MELISHPDKNKPVYTKIIERQMQLRFIFGKRYNFHLTSYLIIFRLSVDYSSRIVEYSVHIAKVESNKAYRGSTADSDG